MKYYRDTHATATNTNKVPSIVKELSFSGKRVFDYGCGKCSDTVCRYAYEHGAKEYRSYDKYWNIGRKPSLADFGEYDMVIIANVLNVIEKQTERFEVYRDTADITAGNKNKIIAIQIYEGDNTGIGRVTTKGYQKNAKTDEYISELQMFFPIRTHNYTVRKNFIFIERK